MLARLQAIGCFESGRKGRTTTQNKSHSSDPSPRTSTANDASAGGSVEQHAPESQEALGRTI